MLNEVEVYPKQKVEDEVAGSESRKSLHGHALGTFTWSPHDVWLGFTDSPEGSRQLVLVSPSGTILREVLPVVVQWDAKIVWIDDKHLELDDGDRTFQFIVNGSKLQETTGNYKE